MLKSEAVRVFGSQQAIADACNITAAGVSQWGELVPPMRARTLARLRPDDLTFNPKLYRHSPALRRLAEALAN